MECNSRNHRDGTVKGRSQFQHPNGHYIKRNATTGRIMDVKVIINRLKV